jgi:hypothetical protein
VDDFITQVIDKRAFMVSSKAERVMGGWYVRGRNTISEDGSGTKLVARLQRLYATSSVKDEVDFFYIPDPAPVTDEDLEMENGNEPVLLITGKIGSSNVGYANPWTKAGISALGLFSIFIFALGACELQPALSERLDEAILLGNTDLTWLTDIMYQTVLSMGAISFAHEIGHLVVAWRDKVRARICFLGLPFTTYYRFSCFLYVSPRSFELASIPSSRLCN